MTDTDQIDALYQLPLDEFTPGRNALAKELKRPAIKELEKPNVAAWAVNQLYWKERPTYDRLVKASERLRGEHRKLLAGKSSDIRDAEKTHRDVIRDAIEKIRGLLADAKQVLSPATLTAVQETLEALPSQDAPGRLTRPLKPMGFEALSDVAIAPGLRLVDKPARKEPGGKATDAKGDSKQDRARERQQAKQREKEEEERKERQREAERELKRAEAAMLKAEEAVKKAEKTLGELRGARDAAVSEYQRARLRAHE